jgi:hypothetical protein
MISGLLGRPRTTAEAGQPHGHTTPSPSSTPHQGLSRPIPLRAPPQPALHYHSAFSLPAHPVSRLARLSACLPHHDRSRAHAPHGQLPLLRSLLYANGNGQGRPPLPHARILGVVNMFFGIVEVLKSGRARRTDLDPKEESRFKHCNSLSSVDITFAA